MIAAAADESVNEYCVEGTTMSPLGNAGVRTMTKEVVGGELGVLGRAPT